MSDPRTMGWLVFSLLATFAILLPVKASFDYNPLGMVAKSRMKRGELRVTSQHAARCNVGRVIALHTVEGCR